MKRPFLVLLSLAVAVASFSFVCFANNTAPALSAKSAVLIDAFSGAVLCEKNPHERMGMASTTKIMTALVAVESCELDRKISVSPKAVGIEGSSIYLYAGECFTLKELLYALLLRSANDAAAAIAIEVGGSIENFADMMNERARELGLENTHFTNPHGLYDEEHYTSAYDLAVIASHALKNKALAEIFSTYKITIPIGSESENSRFLVNHNKMLKLYEGAIGVKTGFTKATGRCLVSAATRDGLTLISVTLDAPDDWQDHTKLLDYGFANYESVLIAAKGAFSYSLPLVGGKNAALRLTNTEELRMTLPRDRDELTLRVETYHRFEFAPTQVGTELGKVVYTYGDAFSASSLLVCAEFAD